MLLPVELVTREIFFNNGSLTYLPTRRRFNSRLIIDKSQFTKYRMKQQN
jgi:hypothetical protein